MAKHTDRAALEQFVAASDKLLNSPFAKQVTQGISTRIAIKNGVLVSVDKKGPDEHALEACLLTVRMFGQNNDALSFGNMGDRIATLKVPQPLKDNFAKSRDNFNAYLDNAPNIRIEGTDAETNRIIFETLMYGMYAHRNADHVARIAKWQESPFYADLQAQFDLIVAEFMRAAGVMANLARKMLKEPI